MLNDTSVENFENIIVVLRNDQARYFLQCYFWFMSSIINPYLFIDDPAMLPAYIRDGLWYISHVINYFGY